MCLIIRRFCSGVYSSALAYVTIFVTWRSRGAFVKFTVAPVMRHSHRPHAIRRSRRYLSYFLDLPMRFTVIVDVWQTSCATPKFPTPGYTRSCRCITTLRHNRSARTTVCSLVAASNLARFFYPWIRTLKRFRHFSNVFNASTILLYCRTWQHNFVSTSCTEWNDIAMARVELGLFFSTRWFFISLY